MSMRRELLAAACITLLAVTTGCNRPTVETEEIPTPVQQSEAQVTPGGAQNPQAETQGSTEIRGEPGAGGQ